MEFYLTIKWNKVLILTTIWLNLKNMLSERNKMQKTMYCMFHLCEKFGEGKFIETENRLVVAKGRRREWGFNVKQHKRGTSPVVQWLRRHTPNAGALSLIPGQRTRSHILQLRLGTAKKEKKKHKGTNWSDGNILSWPRVIQLYTFTKSLNCTVIMGEFYGV